MQVMPELSITLGGGNMSSIFPASLVRQAASLTFAGGDVVGALMKGADPMELFTGSLLNINVNEIMNFLPQVSGCVGCLGFAAEHQRERDHELPASGGWWLCGVLLQLLNFNVNEIMNFLLQMGVDAADGCGSC